MISLLTIRNTWGTTTYQLEKGDAYWWVSLENDLDAMGPFFSKKAALEFARWAEICA